jgi:hypothetical protein
MPFVTDRRACGRCTVYVVGQVYVVFTRDGWMDAGRVGVRAGARRGRTGIIVAGRRVRVYVRAHHTHARACVFLSLQVRARLLWNVGSGGKGWGWGWADGAEGGGGHLHGSASPALLAPLPADKAICR